MGLMTFNTDWKAVQHWYLPTKSMHQVNSCTTAVLISFSFLLPRINFCNLDCMLKIKI
jgi:hypothetical protein